MTHGGNDAAGISARITREVGILAARLANFLASSLPRAEGALAEGQAFLRAMYELVCEGRPLSAWSRHPLERKPLGAPHPLDRLAESLELTPIEIELLLFAGLGEEHEGLAAILRSLHPRNEPRTTVGLAAQLFLPDQSCRPAFREVMETSAVVKSGALGLIGDGPFYEHSLQLADSLWSALHGLDVWPAAVTRLDGPNATTGLDEWFDTIPVRRAIKAIQQRRKCAVVVTADNEETAFHRARAMVAQAGAEPAGILLPPSLEMGLEKLIQIHALARGVVPVLKPASADAAAASDSQSFAAFPEVVVWCGRFGSAGASGQRPFIVVPTERLTPAARRRMWLEVIPSLAAQSKTLASRYCVEPSTATAVAADLRLIAELEGREPTVQDVGASLRARGSASFSGGVKLIRPRATWDELILAADRLK
ncbi:MAG TPA: hypothetical protein VJZ26_10145, partial [Blastocatellia bacterium]|nr:hypothetical protein [Blastocatellia bacterium]